MFTTLRESVRHVEFSPQRFDLGFYFRITFFSFRIFYLLFYLTFLVFYSLVRLSTTRSDLSSTSVRRSESRSRSCRLIEVRIFVFLISIVSYYVLERSSYVFDSSLCSRTTLIVFHHFAHYHCILIYLFLILLSHFMVFSSI